MCTTSATRESIASLIDCSFGGVCLALGKYFVQERFDRWIKGLERIAQGCLPSPYVVLMPARGVSGEGSSNAVCFWAAKPLIMSATHRKRRLKQTIWIVNSLPVSENIVRLIVGAGAAVKFSFLVLYDKLTCVWKEWNVRGRKSMR